MKTAVTEPVTSPTSSLRCSILGAKGVVAGLAFALLLGTANAWQTNFCGAILAQQNVTLSGNVVVDSFNSLNSSQSTNGRYDAAKRGDSADIAAASGLITVNTGSGSTSVYGHLATGPSGSISVSANGSVGSLAWVNGGSRGIQPGWYSTNLWVDFFDATLPGVSFSTLPHNSGTVNGTNYSYVLTTGNYRSASSFTLSGTNKMCINGNVALYFQGGLQVSSSAFIYIAPGARLTVYLGGASTLSGGGAINGTGLATNCAFFGLPACTSFQLSGTSDFIGTVYAPEAALSMSGGSSTNVSFVGKVLANSVSITGPYKFHFDLALCQNCSPPLVYVAPIDQTACPGSTVAFNVSATGIGLTYQWLKNNAPLSGQTTPSLLLFNVSAADAATYSVAVKASCGKPVTNSARLSVSTALSASSLTNLVRFVGANALFTTSASGTGPIAYQWQKNGVNLLGQTSSSLLLTNLAVSDSGTYSVVVSGFCNTVTNSASLLVDTCLPAVDVMLVLDRSGSMGQPISKYNDARQAASNFISNLHLVPSADQAGLVSYNTNATLNQALTNTAAPLNRAVSLLPSPAYNTSITLGLLTAQSELASPRHNPLALPVIVLLSDGLPTSPDTTNQARAAAAQVKNAGTLVFTVGLGKDVDPVLMRDIASTPANYYYASNSSQLSGLFNAISSIICRPPTNIFVSGLSNLTVCVGSSAIFSVAASGCDSYDYQWKKDGLTLPGQTNSLLLLSGVSVLDAGRYSVEVSSSCAKATNSATLTVNPLTVITSGPQSLTNCTGSTATFNVAALGNALNYQWYSAGTALPGRTSSSLTLSNVTLADAGTYSVVVSGACGSPATNSATLAVTPVPVITCVSNKSVEAGAAWSFDAPTANYPLTVLSTVTNPVGQCTFAATRTWQAADPCGNSAQCSQTVTVTDTTAPVLVCPTNLVIAADAGLCSKSNVVFSVGASDNCGSVSVLSTPASGSTFPVGTTLVTNTATDSHGNSVTCAFTVTVTDDQKPSIVCPANIIVAADAGLCSKSNVTFAVEAQDNCGSVSVLSTPASGSTFPVGTTIVTNTATDSHGNSVTCTFTVSVTDDQKPSIVCPANIIVAADAGLCSKSNVTFAVEAQDNCGSVSALSTPASGSTFPVGTTIVTNTATDSHGNSVTCTFTVTVTDDQKPSIVCPANIIVAADAGLCSASNVTFTVGAQDNCGSVNVVSTPASGSTFPVGTTIVTNTATDSRGNSVTCTFTVTVTDDQKPSIVCPANIIVAADAGLCSKSNVTFAVEAQDNCGSVSVLSTPASGSTFPVGTSIVTNTATDSHGNSVTCTFTVTVTDDQKPSLICPTNIIVAADAGLCSASNVTFAVEAQDNCGSVNVVSVPASGSTFPVGTAIVTNTATDSHGNSVTCTFAVTVTDDQKPSLICPTNIIVAADAGLCSKSNVTFTVAALDNCGSVNLVSVPASGSTFRIGTTIVTNTATDSHGNSATCTFAVTVTDNQKPTIFCPANIIVVADAGKCSKDNVTFAVGALDNCGSASIVSTPPSGSTFPVGTTIVTNTATDSRGNSVTCTFTVTVTDDQKPSIVCPTNIIVAADAGLCSKSNVTFTVGAQDNCGSVSVLSTPASGSTFPVGTTIVTNTATDSRGNSVTCTFTVTVTDDQKPSIVCPTNIIVAADAGLCSKSNVTFTVGAQDNCGSVNVVSTPASGSAFPVGTTIVTNTATDSRGNSVTCTVTVTVTDDQKPSIVCPTNIIVVADAGLCSKSNVTFTVGAQDNCGSVNVVSTPASGSTFPVGTTIVTNTATDSHGNSVTCTFTVTVTDDQKPSIVCPANIIVAADAGLCSASNVTFTVGAQDNCGSVNVVSTPASGSTFPVGTTIVTNTATDSRGNSVTCTFTVTVTDDQKPSIVCPTNIIVVADAGLCSKSNVTFTVGAQDNCGSVSVLSTPASGSTFPVGTTLVTNTATDSHGNSVTCAFTVTVTDDQKPSIVCPTNIIVAADAGLCSASNVTFTVGAQDNCGSVNVVSTPASGSTFPVGTTIVTNTATDSRGNSVTCTFTVTVTDDQKPSLVCPTNIIVAADAGLCSKSNVTFTVGAQDNCGSVNVVSTPASGSTFPVGTTIVTNTATDSRGNSVTCTVTVTVTDDQKPSIVCPTNIIVAADAGLCSASNVTFTVGAQDNCGSVNVVSTPASGSTFPVGTTIVTNTATDSRGNSVTCTFTVTVTDDQKPSLVCPTNIIVAADAGLCSKSNVTFTVGAQDNCGSASVVSTPASGSAFPVGTTIVTNTATDSRGNSVTCTFTVTVTDDQKPSLVCPTNIIVAADAGLCSKSNVTFTVGAQDNCGSVNVVSTPASGSTFPVGTTIVTNTATDSRGNSVTCTFTVTVTDDQKPSIVCPTNIIVAADAGLCSKSNVTFTVGAQDNCGSVNVVSAPASGSAFPVGTTIVTNTATDSRGNSVTCTFTVTVTDDQKPSLVCPTNIIVAADAGLCSKSNVTFTVGAQDNCGSASVVSTPASGSAFPVGTTIVTNTATDSRGNSVTCTFTVTVTDDQKPSLVCPTNIIVAADAGLCSKSNVTFTVGAQDNCGSVNVVSTPASGSTFPVGTTIVTNTATDSRGNSVTCTFTVTVRDAQPPVLTCSTNKLAVFGQPWSFDAPQGSDNCSGVEIVVVGTLTNNGCGNGITATRTWLATDASGNFAQCSQSVTVVDPTPIVVTNALTSQTTCPGSDVTFSIGATGTSLTYAWLLDQTLLGTNSSLVVRSPSSLDTGTYTVIVTDQCGNTLTDSATLSLYSLTGATPLQDTVACAGQPVEFATTASGSGPFTYLWFKNGALISSQNSNRLVFASVTTNDAGAYRVVVFGHCSSVTNSALLFVNALTTTTPLGGAVKNLGDSITFSTVPSGTPPFRFAWKKNGILINGATGSSLTLTNLSYSDDSAYAVEVTGAGSCNTALQSAKLTINHPPFATIINPTNGSVFVGPLDIGIESYANDTDDYVVKVEYFVSATNKVGESTSGHPWHITWTNVPLGQYTLTAKATDSYGATGFSAPVNISVVASLPVTIAGPIKLNYQTGFWEQTAHISNPTPESFSAVGVLVYALPTGWRLQNATFATNGVPVVMYNQPLPAGGSADITLKYFLGTNASTNAYPTLAVVAMEPGGTPTAVGLPVGVTRSLFLQDGTFLLNFNTVSNKTYSVEFSSDLKTWTTSPQTAIGNGQTAQWIDYGPPATTSMPKTTSARFYRVIQSN